MCGLCAAHEILELPPWSKRGSGKSGGAGDSYLVHDIDSFKNLLLTKREPVPPSQASVFDVYCGRRVRCRRTYPGDERAEVWDADHPERAIRNRYSVPGR